MKKCDDCEEMTVEEHSLDSTCLGCRLKLCSVCSCRHGAGECMVPEETDDR